jgi:hypothetical protein
VVQEQERVRWAETREISGEEGEPLLGTRVGRSEFRMQKLLFSMASAKFFIYFLIIFFLFITFYFPTVSSRRPGGMMGISITQNDRVRI